MDTIELRSRLAAILDDEEDASVNWIDIERRCLELAEEIRGREEDCPEIVLHYLCDSDIRGRDVAYADHQRDAVRRYVLTGEYDDSVAVPWWGCWGFLVLVGAGLAWLLLKV